MVGIGGQCEGPLSAWVGPLAGWLEDSGCAPGRARRAVLAFARLSSWMAAQGLSAADLDEDVIDEHIGAEQQWSGSRFPAAFQYLPLAKRFLAAHGVLVLRGRKSRDRGGIPRLSAGPLAGVLGDLVVWLRAEGYARGTAQSVACTAARLGAWMGTEGLGVDRLDDDVLDRFVAAQPRGPVPHPSSARRIATVRKFLITAGVIVPAEDTAPAATPVQICLQQWGQYLRAKRGVSPGWVGECQGWARAFLEQMTGPDGQIRWEVVDARGVNRYITGRGRGYSLSSRRHLVAAMKSLLRWAFATGLVEQQMAAAVLSPPARTLAGLPRALTATQVEAIKAAADVTTTIGLRDYALVVMISRLGLRAGEVAALRLDDLDWHHGQLTVHGKGGRQLSLPLPVDVGHALVGYLRSARPDGVADRAVFVRARPPRQGLTGKGVSAVVARLARRAGLGTVHAHRLRHTAATAVLAHGGSLVEARELLGHSRTDTTMIYAKTDMAALGALVIAWGQVPGS